MAWQQPGHNEQNNNSWIIKNNQENFFREKENNMSSQELPDLYDVLKKFSRKLSFFGRNTDKDSGNGKNPYMRQFTAGYIIIVAIIAWIISGFYTIKEAERGVVIRFGKFSHIVQPGLNWKPFLIDEVMTVNVELVRELAAYGVMLTADENVVHVEMNVQYRVTEPKNYLFNVTNGDDSLRQATDSALRGVIGRYTMDRILTEGRTVIRNDTQYELEQTIRPYNMGITLLDVNFQAARPPDEVKAAFDDAIAARENEQQYIREAEAYANEVQPHANGKAQRILEEARAYCVQTILEAQGEVARFMKLLPEYKSAPEITRQRLYMETMEKVLSHTRKVLVNENKRNNIIVFPLETILNSSYTAPFLQNNRQEKNNILSTTSSISTKQSHHINNTPSLYSNGNITNQRRENAQRKNNY